MSFDQIRDSAREASLTRRRLLVVAAVAAAMMAVLMVRLADLQLGSYQHYRTLSQQNRINVVPVPPTRGLIYDRNGVLLAENVTAHRLMVTPERVENIDRTIERLAEIVELRPTDRERFRELLDRQRRFQEIPLKLQLSDAEVARLAVNRHEFPGVEVRPYLVRQYPLGEVASHAVGYVGRINERELQAAPAGTYRGLSHIGKTGIEASYEDRLRGEVGTQRVETNALGRVIRTLDRDPPTPGEDLYLTLDIQLQRVAERALGDYSGSVVALDPATGEVLAFVSKPTFNPNLFVNGISLKNYAALQTRRDQPLFNRALRGQYPPGSTFKPFVGLAGLDTDVRTAHDEMDCRGVYTLPGVDHRWRDWKRWGHGEVDMISALAESCDIYFYDLAYELGIATIHDFLAPFGFGEPTGIDLNGELGGILPSKQWKRRARGEPWYHGETVITGIGQGFTLTTPLQLAYATSILANRGHGVTPHLLRGARGPEQKTPTPARPETLQRVNINLRNPAHWETITAGMEAVVHGEHGTARAVGADAPYRFAGKTGTAQVFGLDEGQEYEEDELATELHDHALFIAFAPIETPEIAVAVVVENGGSGSGTAAPIARTVMDAWLTRETTRNVADNTRQ